MVCSCFRLSCSPSQISQHGPSANKSQWVINDSKLHVLTTASISVSSSLIDDALGLPLATSDLGDFGSGFSSWRCLMPSLICLQARRNFLFFSSSSIPSLSCSQGLVFEIVLGQNISAFHCSLNVLPISEADSLHMSWLWDKNQRGQVRTVGWEKPDASEPFTSLYNNTLMFERNVELFFDVQFDRVSLWVSEVS